MQPEQHPEWNLNPPRLRPVAAALYEALTEHLTDRIAALEARVAELERQAGDGLIAEAVDLSETP